MAEHIYANLRIDDASTAVASIGTVLAGLVLLLFFAQRVSEYAYLPPLSLAEYLWHGIVSLIPSWLIRPRSGQDSDRNTSTAYAAKSQTLRSIFGLDRVSSSIARESEELQGPKGLGNWDNSCYQNSVLQALSSVPSVATFLASYDRMQSDDSQGTTTLDLASLISELNDQSSSARYLWTPPRLKSMDSWQQQDAQEYYARISDEIEKDFLKVLRLKEAVGGLETLEDTSKSVPIASNQDTDRSMVNPMEGLLAQRVACTKCGYAEGLSLIPFTSITLPLPNVFSCDVAECLDNFTALESIEGVECLKCTLLQARQQLLDDGDPGPAVIADGSPVEEATEVVDVSAYSNKLLQAIEAAIVDEDFTDAVLSACHIPKQTRATSTKTRQAVVMRPPQCLALHFNRSMFDESTGDLRKNYSATSYPKTLALGRWCLGGAEESGIKVTQAESWSTSPVQSMLPAFFPGISQDVGPSYNLCAVVTHFGRHENGHYVCFRRMPGRDKKKILAEETEAVSLEMDHDFHELPEPTWWRISDEKVSAVSEREALAQEGAFMLFYEKSDDTSSNPVTAIFPSAEPFAGVTESSVQMESEDVADVSVPETLEVEPSAQDHKGMSTKPTTLPGY